MGEILVIYVLYSIYACIVLVWSTLLDEERIVDPQVSWDGVEFVAIRDRSFRERPEQHPNLLIFDVHPNHGVSGWWRFPSNWLPISAVDLPSVMKCLPPGSRVGFCCRAATEDLDPPIKMILLQLGIKTVYFLSASRVTQGNRWLESEITVGNANREPRTISNTETRRQL